VEEEVDELYPGVDDASEFTGVRVTDIATRPVREKRRSQNLQAIFIEEFLDNIFATENMTHPGISYTEDISNASDTQDYNLIEMFLDLILM